MQDSKELSTGKYSPALTAQIRMQNITDILTAKREMMKKSPDRVNLHDLDAVQGASDAYMEHCIKYSILPSFQGLSAFFGISRVALYKHLDRHRETPTGKYLEKLRSLYTDCRITAADRGSCPETLCIFLLKNTSEGYSDKSEIALTPEKPDPLGELDVQAARERLLMSIPDEDDD